MDVEDYPKCNTCKHFFQVNCHPWNQTIGKGGMNDKLGYVCLLFTEQGIGGEHGTFMDRDWGTCECHTAKGN